jgi:DNA adenine methylase
MEGRVKSPVQWFGGKGAQVNNLLPLFPEHRIYVEPFGGGASMLLAKQPSPIEVYNDLDSGLVTFFRVLRDKRQFREFLRMASLTPYSREEHSFCLETWESAKSVVEKAYKWFVAARSNFSGIFPNSWGYTVTQSSRGMAGSVSRWLGAVERLPEVALRLLQVMIEHDQGHKVVSRFDTEETFFYCDPPYVPETRRGGEYRHEMTAADHEELVGTLVECKGKVLLSGYDSPIYDRLVKLGWWKRSWEANCRAAGRTRRSGLLGAGACAKQKRTETVWANYPLPEVQ